MIEAFGWLSTVCFALCPLPQAMMAIKQGHTRGLSQLTLILWLIGEAALMIYSSMGLGWDMPVFLNASISTIWTVILIRYSFFPRKSCETQETDTKKTMKDLK